MIDPFLPIRHFSSKRGASATQIVRASQLLQLHIWLHIWHVASLLNQNHKMSRASSILVSGLTFAGLVVSGALIFNKEGQPLQASVGFSLAAFIFTVILIPPLKNVFIREGFLGKDLAKPKRPIL
jgi:hypothetical protein